jgi:gliding motility-associated-like protein
MVTLTASGASTYSWDNGVTQGVAFTPSTTTVYTVLGTDANGCVNTDNVTVNVNALPNVEAGNNQTICVGQSVTLTASGANTYTWTGGVNQGVAFSPTSTQIYTVTGTDLNGCTSTDAVTVNVNPLPNVSAGDDQTVCDGTSITLSGTGASTYTWDNGVVDGVPFTQAVGQATYTVSGTDLNGCVNSDQVIVTVNPNPIPEINGATEYCTGNSALLSTSVVYNTYNWSNGATTATINATEADSPITVTVSNSFGCFGTSSPFTVTENNVITANYTITICEGQSALIHGVNQTTAGLYSETFVSVQGCDSISNVNLVVNPLPNVNAGPDVAICIGQTTTLTATGAAIYSWNNGVVNGITFTPAATNTYTVVGTSAEGCINTDEVVVTVNPLPNVNAGPDQALCIGLSVTLSGSGASTYTWNNGVTNNVSFVPNASNEYTVIGTDVNGCVNSDQVVVIVNPLPTINAGQDIAVCIGSTVTLSGNGGISYTWDNGVTNGVSFTPSTTLTYTVSGTDEKGCVNSDQVVVTVNPLPNIDAGPDVTLCFGQSTTLNATGGVIYTWNNGAVQGGSVSPSTTTTYSVTGTDANGCVNSDNMTVNVNPLPIVDAGANQTICEGETVTLNATGATSYTWTPSATNGVVFTPAVGTTTYTVTGTDNNGCLNTDQVVIVVNPLPNVFAGNDVAVCDGETVTLTGSGAATYTWDNNINNGAAFNPSLGTTTYTVTGTSSAGCINTDQVNVTANPNPEVSFLPGATLGCAPFTTTLTNTSTNSDNCTWTLSNGQTLTGCGTIPVTFQQAGCYDVTLTTTSTTGCSSSFTASNLICVEAPPNAAFSPSANQVSNLDTEVNFINNTTGASNYVWSFGDGSGTSTEINPSHTYPTDPVGQYEVMLIAYSPFGCTDTAYSTIQIYEELIFYVPNTFTPDSDKFNPVFLPVFTAGFDPYDYNLLIFNRWGEIIFESNNAEVGWDGSYGKNGEIEMCQDGTYTWKIEFKVTRWDERRMAIGHVNLIR